MTVDEIFEQLASHLIQGMMVHEQLANYYDFLGLKGYKRCHEYHYMQESCEYRGICRYYINHFNRLIKEPEFKNPDVIPESWYSHTRDEVDMTTKRNAVQNGLEKWRSWETDTKKLYQEMYKELLDLGEIAAADKVNELVCAVDCELKKVERYVLNKEAINYDMSSIIEEQNHKHKKYKKKCCDIGVHIC